MITHIITAIIFVCSFIEIATANLEAEYDHAAFLDPDENYQLFWSVKDTDKTMNIAVKVNTTGWVGFGISRGLSGSMKGADVVIGWVDSNGKGHISDRHATSNSMPLVDNKQDYELIGASQDSGSTILKFKRKLETCDKNDLEIPLGTTKVIYAYGQSDDIKYHGSSNRGARSLNLMNYVKNVPPPKTAKYFDVTIQKVPVPKQKTTYYCEAFKMSDLVTLSSVKHIIEIAPIVEKKDKGVVHHMVLYACQDNFDETHLNASGECYHPNMPDSVRQCVGRAAVYAWAIGGVNFKFPDHVGWPIGAPYSMKYMVLETHFDNPSQRTDFIVTSGLRLHYDKPRKYESETLVAGHTVNTGMVIPPKQKDWIINGYCSKECSKRIAGANALNGNEVKIFASFPHAHTTGTGIWTKHVRNGVEQPEIIRDENYDFDYQQTHLLRKELPFQAGDELITYCRYNTMKRKDAVIGGESTTEEMCLNYIMYYPRVNWTMCFSTQEKVQNPFSVRYAKPVWAHGGKYYNKSAPPVAAQFLNWTDVKWNDSMVNELKDIYQSKKSSIRSVCFGSLGVKLGIERTQKAVINKGLPSPADSCTKVPSAAVTPLPGIALIIFSFSLVFYVVFYGHMKVD